MDEATKKGVPVAQRLESGQRRKVSVSARFKNRVPVFFRLLG